MSTCLHCKKITYGSNNQVKTYPRNHLLNKCVHLECIELHCGEAKTLDSNCCRKHKCLNNRCRENYCRTGNFAFCGYCETPSCEVPDCDRQCVKWINKNYLRCKEHCNYKPISILYQITFLPLVIVILICDYY